MHREKTGCGRSRTQRDKEIFKKKQRPNRKHQSKNMSEQKKIIRPRTNLSGEMEWQCQKCGQKHTRRGCAKQCKCQKWCTMCSKLVDNVNKHILLSITEGGHGGYRCGTKACTKVFRRAANLRRHAKACKSCLYCDDVFKGGKMDHMRPDLYIGFDCSRF